MGLRFTQIDRQLVKMLFVRGLVSEVSGRYGVAGHRRWEIIERKASTNLAESYFDVGLDHDYKWHRCETLDEAMDKLENLSKGAGPE